MLKVRGQPEVDTDGGASVSLDRPDTELNEGGFAVVGTLHRSRHPFPGFGLAHLAIVLHSSHHPLPDFRTIHTTSYNTEEHAFKSVSLFAEVRLREALDILDQSGKTGRQPERAAICCDLLTKVGGAVWGGLRRVGEACPRTRSLTGSVARSVSHSLTHSLTPSLPHSLPHSLTQVAGVFGRYESLMSLLIHEVLACVYIDYEGTSGLQGTSSTAMQTDAASVQILNPHASLAVPPPHTHPPPPPASPFPHPTPPQPHPNPTPRTAWTRIWSPKSRPSSLQTLTFSPTSSRKAPSLPPACASGSTR